MSEPSMHSGEIQNEGFRLDRLHSLRFTPNPGEPIFDDIVRLAALVCDVPVSVIALIDEERVRFKARTGLELDEIPRAGSFCTYTILQSEVMIIHDPLSDERFASNYFVSRLGIKFYAGIPLTASDRHRFGALAIMDRVPHLLTEEQIISLQILARLIVTELEARHGPEGQSSQRRLHLARGPQLSSTILLVEDNENLRDLLQRTLEGTGSHVFSAADGAEAVLLWQEHQDAIDLLVTDIALPRLNGLQLAEHIRATNPEMKLLFITGFAEEFPELNELVRDGASVIEKPFLPSELVNRVEQIVSKRNTATGTEGD